MSTHISTVATDRLDYIRRISWGAIFAGVVTFFAIHITLSLLGLGIGASTVDPKQEANPASGLGIGGAIWFFISGLLALFAGGWVAGRVAGVPERGDGRLHGFMAWALATVLSVFMLTTAVSGLLGGTASMLGRMGSTAAQTVAGQQGQSAGAQQADVDVTSLATDPETQELAKKIYQQGQMTPQDREQLVSKLSQNSNISRPDAEKKVAQFEQSIQRARAQMGNLEQKAREAGDKAATGVSAAGIGSFFMFLLGAVAATFGGGMGAERLLRRSPATPQEIRRRA
jgi:hypothetical protein